MRLLCGIDEAGYGPLLGPLTIARAVIEVPDADDPEQPIDVWSLVTRAVHKTLTGRKGRLVVADSKKFGIRTAGLTNLEASCLAFAHAAGCDTTRADLFFDALSETTHQQLDHLPWYAPTAEHPWQSLPTASTPGEHAIARSMLQTTLTAANVRIRDLGLSLVFEDTFNDLVAKTHSKASASFTYVARHLIAIWRDHGRQHPHVVIDRQSGRTRYRELLAMLLPDAQLRILDETPQRSAYQLTEADRTITVSFETKADGNHFPVALASMLAKYSRELMMDRLNSYFIRHLPDLKPTAGYTTDGRRFMNDLKPHLPALDIHPHSLCRIA
ncbi:hypothetical protein [Mucisphaera sp.]|uniref:hypothetical protein n=1 Tax=Mucisphaera sp. TaxID=2913024 RepID=UPI003D0D77FB